MTQETQEATETPKRSIYDILRETEEGRKALKGLLDPLFKDFWTDVLNLAFEWFPHEKGDRSTNERAFSAIRHRVLRYGNNQARLMAMILNDFAVVQLLTTTFDRKEVVGHGAFNLPPGVKMPPKRV